MFFLYPEQGILSLPQNIVGDYIKYIYNINDQRDELSRFNYVRLLNPQFLSCSFVLNHTAAIQTERSELFIVWKKFLFI